MTSQPLDVYTNNSEDQVQLKLAPYITDKLCE